MAVESAFLAMMMIIVLNTILGPGNGGSSSPRWWVIVSALIMAPLLETVLCQSIPVRIIEKLRGGFWSQVFFSATIFAILHFWILGFIPGMTAGLFGGFYLAYTYVHWNGRSRKRAYWSTVLVHFLYNLTIIVIATFAGAMANILH